MWRCLIALLVACTVSGCGITVIPQQTTSAAVDGKQRSVTSTAKEITVTARVQDLEIAPYRLQNNVTSFYLIVSNGGKSPFILPLEAFMLVDDQSRQYRPLSPSAVIEMSKRDSEYLIPYPYVGYYYLEDRERAASSADMGSDLPYHVQNHPQSILLEALPVQPILPLNSIAGMVYFPIDLYTKNSFEMRIYLSGTTTNAPPDIVFPFIVKH